MEYNGVYFTRIRSPDIPVIWTCSHVIHTYLLIFDPKHRLSVLVRTARRGVSTINDLSKIIKNINKIQ